MLKKDGLNIGFVTTVFMCLIMIVIASFGVIGVFFPAIKKEFAITDTQFSFMITIDSILATACTFFGGKVCDVVGHKKSFLIGILIMGVSGICMTLVSNFAMLIVVNAFVGVGVSLSTITANASIPLIYVTAKAIFMNIFHLCNNVGASVSQKIGGWLTDFGINWKTLYVVMGIVSLILLPLLFYSQVPTTNGKQQRRKIKIVDIMKKKQFVFFVLIAGCYLGSASASFNWMVNYINVTYHYSSSQSSTYLSIFTLLIALGMFLFLPLLKKFDEWNLIIAFSVLAFLVYVTGLLLNQNGLYIMAFSGVFYSIIYPTALANVNKEFSESPSLAMGLIVTFGSLISTSINFLIGVLNDFVGTTITYYIIPIMVGLIAVLSFILKHLLAHPKENII